MSFLVFKVSLLILIHFLHFSESTTTISEVISTNSPSQDVFVSTEESAVPSTDTEVNDLLEVRTTSFPKWSNENQEDDDELNVDDGLIIKIENTFVNPSELDIDLSEKNDTELIEDENAETLLEMSKTIERARYDDEQKHIMEMEGHITMTFAVTFLLVCLIIFAALVTWRQRLEDRYGSRQILVANDYNDHDDIRSEHIPATQKWNSIKSI